MKKYSARVGHSYTAILPEDWRGCSGRHVCSRIQRPQRTPAMRPTWPLHSLDRRRVQAVLRRLPQVSIVIFATMMVSRPPRGQRSAKGNGTRAYWASAAPK